MNEIKDILLEPPLLRTSHYYRDKTVLLVKGKYFILSKRPIRSGFTGISTIVS
jgi:hypothetical protein